MRLPVILELNLLSGEHKASHDVFDIIELATATLLTHTFAFIIVLEFKRYE